MPAGIVWTDERVALLKKLWADGYSCSQCATRIGGITRNAVIGKVSRLKLAPRTTTSRNPAAKRRPRSLNHPRWVRRESLVPIATEPLPPRHETDIPRIAFVSLEDTHCKFPCLPDVAGPFVKQFCGQPRVEGLPYCTVHAQRCYTPPQARNRPPAPRPTPAIPLLEDA